jgi:hypothetical protein
MGRGPLKGVLTAPQSQNHMFPAVMLIADFSWARSNTAGIVKLGLPPRQSRGSLQPLLGFQRPL